MTPNSKGGDSTWLTNHSISYLISSKWLSSIFRLQSWPKMFMELKLFSKKYLRLNTQNWLSSSRQTIKGRWLLLWLLIKTTNLTLLLPWTELKTHSKLQKNSNQLISGAKLVTSLWCRVNSALQNVALIRVLTSTANCYSIHLAGTLRILPEWQRMLRQMGSTMLLSRLLI